MCHCSWCVLRQLRLQPCHGSDSLGTFVRGVTGAVVAVITVISAGCGGGATAVTQQVQAQVADFSAAVSSSSVTISQGGVSTPVNFSIVPRNGFSGSVQVMISSLPV